MLCVLFQYLLSGSCGPVLLLFLDAVLFVVLVVVVIFEMPANTATHYVLNNNILVLPLGSLCFSTVLSLEKHKLDFIAVLTAELH